MTLQQSANKILVFVDPAYPGYQPEAILEQLVPGTFQCVGADHLANYLQDGYSLLISFHGAYFPKMAWNALFGFLKQGGNLAVFGGMPFSRPVTEDGLVEIEQDTYAREIYLGPYCQIENVYKGLRFVADDEAIFLKESSLDISPQNPGTFWAFNPKLTQKSDHPEDLGSAGPFDTVLQPLLYALGSDAAGKEYRIATLASLLDQRSGLFKGGRWLISPWQPATEADWLKNAEIIRRLIALVAQETTVLDVRPTFGCYQAGETATIVISARTNKETHVRIAVYAPEHSEPFSTFNVTFPASAFQQEQVFPVPASLQAGLYRIVAEYESVGGQSLACSNGFWVWSPSLVEETKQYRLTAKRDYFFWEEKPFLLFGTTYMDSRVQRKFLNEPNPVRWDRDFAEMKAAGINIIRTGIWTAWRELFPVAGRANEALLRALDAFVMTACQHRIQVIFTFFSFFPPLFEGENPWLDPRSVEAQQDSIGLLARRYAAVELLSWDLINEPSFGDPKRIFAQRPFPNNDQFEIAAFQKWLQARFSLNELQLRWRKTPGDLPDWQHVLPPKDEEYDVSIRMAEARSLLQVADYTRFSQDMFKQWAAQMYEAIRFAGSKTLVGVGQDESATRISPQFYGEQVDYTTTHPWWNIDDLLWDMLVDKTLEKPNVIQETGIMQLRDIDGIPWFSQQESARLLERKLITGLIARSAGLIQWLWHTNGYMTDDNENSIGLVRVDGSVKPERLILEEFGRLCQALAGQLIEKATPPDVWIVLPYSQWFVRPDLARLGTQQAVRVLAYDLGITPQLVGEHLLSKLETVVPPRAIIVPALQLLDQQAWRHLLKYVQAGGKLLVNGVLTRDMHHLPVEHGLEGLPDYGSPVPVAHYEELQDETGRSYLVTFGNEKMSYVKKAHNSIYRCDYGKGTILWCGLPIELANETHVIRSLYAQITATRPITRSGNNPLLLARQTLRNGTLILLVSDANTAQKITLDEGITITVAANRAGAVIIDAEGIISTFGGVTHLATSEA